MKKNPTIQPGAVSATPLLDRLSPEHKIAIDFLKGLCLQKIEVPIRFHSRGVLEALRQLLQEARNFLDRLFEELQFEFEIWNNVGPELKISPLRQ